MNSKRFEFKAQMGEIRMDTARKGAGTRGGARNDVEKTGPRVGGLT